MGTELTAAEAERAALPSRRVRTRTARPSGPEVAKTITRKTKLRMAQYEKLRAKGIGPMHAARAVGWSDAMFRQLRRRYPDWYLAVEKGHQVSIEQQIEGADSVGERPPVPDFETFRQAVFGLDTPEHMQIIAEHLLDPSCKRLLVLVPPEHAKTTLVNRDWLTYLLCEEAHRVGMGERLDNPIRAAVMSQTSTYAQTIGWQLREALEDADLYPELHRWGPFRDGNKWSERAIYAGWRKGEEKDPSVQWIGWKNQIQGARLTHVILDDVDTPEYGNADRDKILTKFDHTVARRLGTGGKAIVIGTRVGEDDVYSRFLERCEVPGSPWRKIVLPALKPDGEPLWPERFTADYFDSVRAEMNNDPLFNLVYQQIESLGDSAVFLAEHLEAAKDPELDLHEPLDGGITICALDPADEGPWAAMAIAWHPVDQTVRVLDVLAGEEGGYDNMVGAVDWMLAFRPHHVGVEKQGGHSIFLGEKLKGRISAAGARLHLIQTTAQGLVDQSYGMTAFAGWFARNDVEIPWAPAARRAMGPLLDELGRWHPGTNSRRDRAMAAWFCFRIGMSVARPALQVTYGPTSRAAPWLRQHQRQVIVRRD